MSPYQLLKYGLDKETNSLVFIDNVPNGNACGCICPNCKYELVAKNGGLKKEHHFAHTHTHTSGADCPGARMTALHMLAQEVFIQLTPLPSLSLNPAIRRGFFMPFRMAVSFSSSIVHLLPAVRLGFDYYAPHGIVCAKRLFICNKCCLLI